MASPVQLCVIPNCGLDIEIVDGAFERLSNINDKSTLWKYRVKGVNQFLYDDSQSTPESYHDGFLSPTYDITLPKAIKKKAGIPEEACRYAYMYPPSDLAEKINWQAVDELANADEFEDNLDINNSLNDAKANIVHYWAVPYTAILGAFVYFDNKNKIMQVNALSNKRTKTDNTLKLSGPFHPRDTVCKELKTLKRVVVCKLDAFHESGYSSYCWLRPNESFQGNNISDEHSHCHGSFLFFREDDGNDNAISYAVDSSGYVNQKNGETDILADIFTDSFALENLDGSSFQDKYRKSSEAEEFRSKFEAQSLSTGGDGNTLISSMIKSI